MAKTNEIMQELQKAFNTGVSFMLPAVVVGGIFLALALSTGEATSTGMNVTNTFMKNLTIRAFEIDIFPINPNIPLINS